MGMGQTVKYVFRLTFKRTERSLHRKGKAVDSHVSLPCCNDHNISSDEDDIDSDSDFNHLAVSTDGSRKRVVSWTSIAEQTRWKKGQERELAIAEHELARCQKAWSSEQELWLEYIKTLLEEKEAHEEFLHHRAKQLDDEQQRFRKAWSRRRRSGEEQYGPRRSLRRLSMSVHLMEELYGV